MSGQARLAFYGALVDAGELGGSPDDRAVARWVGSALEGIARGFDDAGDDAGASALRFAGSDVIRDLASGRWRAEAAEAGAVVDAAEEIAAYVESYGLGFTGAWDSQPRELAGLIRKGEWRTRASKPEVEPAGVGEAFAVDDRLVLVEWDPAIGKETGRALEAGVSYVLRGAFGVPEGFAVLSLVGVRPKRDQLAEDRALVARLAAIDDGLTEWEVRFVESLSRWVEMGTLTPAQRARALDIDAERGA